MKKFLIILLTVLMLLPSGCKKKDPDPKPKPDDPITGDVQTQFNEMQKNWFIEGMEADYTDLHFSLVDPSKYGISDVEVTLGDIHYDVTEEDKQSVQDLKDKLTELHRYNIEELTEDQQIMYQCMEYYLELQIGFSETEKDYTFAFTPNSGLNNNLVTVFTEFDFRSEQDVKDFITLLNDTGRYVDQAIEYTRRQAQDGIVQADSVIKSVQEQIDRFTSNTDNNEIIKVFTNAMNQMNLAGRNEYIEEVKKGVLEILIPAFKRVYTMYDELKGQCRNDGAMSDYGQSGKDEYALIVKNKISTDKSISTIESDVRKALDKAYNSIIKNMDVDITEGYGYSDPYEILAYLKQAMAKDYPTIPEVDYDVAFLDKSVTSENTSAYYLIAPLDDPNKNVVKVNPSFVETDPDGICITLAHEGYPGHLYQNTYYLTNHPGNEFRYSMSFLGYAEGWAEYCEMKAYEYFLKNSREITYMQQNNMFNYLLYSYVDMKVHYDGWKNSDIVDFLKSYFQASYARSIAKDIMETVIGDPGLFLPYGVGMLYMISMREDTEKTLESKFNLQTYNKVILDTGEAPFPVLKQQVQKYIDANK